MQAGASIANKLMLAISVSSSLHYMYMGEMEQLLAVTPLDGRYSDKVEALSPIVSEFGLIQRRVAVEVGWLSTLASGVLPDVAPLADMHLDALNALPGSFSIKDAKRIKEIERTTNHDVKAVEVWLREELKLGNDAYHDYIELVHFGCTSEDINNLAYALMVRDVRDRVLVPEMDELIESLESKAGDYASIPMLARTHGQPATPTTLGKEMEVFSERLCLHTERLGSIAILGKFNGASGNYNAVTVAYPEVDWPSVSRQFIESLGFGYNRATTQIDAHDWLAAFTNEAALGNTILIDVSRDMWTYIMLGYFKQRVKAGEVGSSTMPHKVNPIDFENAEANFGVANSIFGHLAAKLPISRLQRDLSDSSAQRALGEAFGHTLVGQKSIKRGLGKIYPDEAAIQSDLDKEWAVLTEAVQTVMRRYKVSGGYDAMKAASRGKSLTETDYIQIIEDLDIPDEARVRLRQLSPSTYIGRARDIALRRI